MALLAEPQILREVVEFEAGAYSEVTDEAVKMPAGEQSLVVLDGIMGCQ